MKDVPQYPDFYCIGAQKAGTTWLHTNLRQHPRIWLPPVKELHYFNQLYIPSHKSWTQAHRDDHARRMLFNQIGAKRDDMDLRYIRMLSVVTDPNLTDEWYKSVFAYAGPNRLAADMTPEYSLLPEEGIDHILRLSPNAKFVLILRDPIARSWSHVRMLWKRSDFDTNQLRNFVSLREVFERSDYPTILEKWRKRVSPENLFVGLFDDIEARPAMFLESVLSFLGLDFDPEQHKEVWKEVHKGESLEIPDDIYNDWRKKYLPIYEALGGEFPDQVAKWRSVHEM
jgi:hypothetical protein